MCYDSNPILIRINHKSHREKSNNQSIVRRSKTFYDSNPLYDSNPFYDPNPKAIRINHIIHRKKSNDQLIRKKTWYDSKQNIRQPIRIYYKKIDWEKSNNCCNRKRISISPLYDSNPFYDPNPKAIRINNIIHREKSINQLFRKWKTCCYFKQNIRQLIRIYRKKIDWEKSNNCCIRKRISIITQATKLGKRYSPVIIKRID